MSIATARVARGVPAGGQFATTSRSDDNISLDQIGAPFKLPASNLNEAVLLSRLDVLDHARARAGYAELDDSYAVATASHLHDRIPGDAPGILAVAVLGRVDYEAIATDIGRHYRHLGSPERALADALGTWAMNHERAATRGTDN